MTKRRHTMGVVAGLYLLLLLPTRAPAATQGRRQAPLSLSECISAALAHNTDVLAARVDVVAAESRLTKAKSSYLPQLAVQNNAFSWGSNGVLNKTATGTAFTASQTIWDGGLREAGVRGARYGVQERRAGLSRAEQSVVFDTTRAYYSLLRARHFAEVAHANVSYTEGLRDQVKARADVGDAARVDVLPIEAQLAAARVSLVSAQNDIRISAIQLQNLMGLDSRTDFQVADVPAIQPIRLESLKSYTTAALESRPDILQSNAAVNVSQASVKSARIACYPRPTVSADWERRIEGGFTTGGGQIVGGVVFNIFNGGANRAAYREAESSLSKAQLQAQQTLRDVRSQVEEACLNVTSATERIKASAASLESAIANYEAQKERYSQGLGVTLDLLNAEIQVISAQTDDVQARYDYHTAVAELEYAVGKQRGVK